MAKIEFTIKGKPMAQKRHRDRRGGKGKYDPSKPDKEKIIAMMRTQGVVPSAPLEGPLEITIDCYFQRPKKHYVANDRDYKIKFIYKCVWHSQKPDFDNVAKFYCDAMTGSFWIDDAQIAKATVRKYWAANEESVYISVIPIDQIREYN